MLSSRPRTASHQRPHGAPRRAAGARPFTAVVLLVALVVAGALAAACSAQATAGSAASTGSAASSASTGTASPGSAAPAADGAVEEGGKAASTSDWGRIASAIAYMRAKTPTQPVVALLGGSAARESTISDKSWRDQIAAKGGGKSMAWNMGSHNRTMAQNLAIVKALPPVPTVVFIGINPGSFTSPQKAASISLPSPAPTTSPTLQQPHSYSVSKILTPARKAEMVQRWLTNQYPLFKTNFSSNTAILEKVITTCQAKGFTPVLFELPLNTTVVGHKLDSPLKRYRDKCKALSTKYGIQWIPLMVKLPNADFYDVWHLVEPGRKIWQGMLSAKTAKILTSDAFENGSGS